MGILLETTSRSWGRCAVVAAAAALLARPLALLLTEVFGLVDSPRGDQQSAAETCCYCAGRPDRLDSLRRVMMSQSR